VLAEILTSYGITILLILLAYQLGTVVHEWITVRRLMHSGLDVDGKIITTRVSQYRGTYHYVIYEYIAPDTTTKLTNEQLVSPENYARLVSNDAVPVRYLPTNPVTSRLWHGHRDNTKLERSIIGTVAFLAGVVFVLIFLAATRR
jgi:hypothetical protein